jgi:hypothetical protein
VFVAMPAYTSKQCQFDMARYYIGNKITRTSLW